MNPALALKAVLIALLLVSFRAFGSPLDVARIPADADGVGHLDMDALRKTTLHRLIGPKMSATSHWEVEPELRPILKALLDTAQGVSFWLTDHDTGAVLVQVPDPRRIQALLEKIPHRKAIRVAGQVAHKYNFPAHKGATSGDDNLAAIVGNVLVLADDETSLGQAIEAASGRRATLASAKKTPDGALERGVFFFSALNDKLLSEVKNAAQSKTLRINMSSLTIHVGEIRAELKLRVKAMMGSPDEAAKIKSMAEGVIALASMSDEASELRPFTKSLKITTNGKAIELSLTVPSADMFKFIESHH